MAITLFAVTSTPADGASATNTATQNTVVWPANMKVGDLAFVYMQQRGTATMSVGVSGNQNWRDGMERQSNGSTISTKFFWCRFNGNSSTNARFDFSAGTCTTVVMIVFRPSDTSKFWAIDLEPSAGTFTAGSTPFTKTITGITTTRASSVTLAVWATADDNTWGSLSGTGWSNTSLSAQYRNTSGSDQSVTFAYNIQTSAGATNNVSQNQATLGGDAGITTLVSFYERDSDYIGDPTIYNSTFAGGDRLLVHKAYAENSGNGVLMRLRGYSTEAGGTTDIYPVLYRLNGGTYEYLATGSAVTITTTEQWWTLSIKYPISAGTTYYIGYYAKQAFDFRYMFRGIEWAAGESWDHYVGSGTVPPAFADIAVGSVTNNYQTHESIEIQFSNSLGGAISDAFSDNVIGMAGKIKLYPMNENRVEFFGDINGNTSGPSTAVLGGLSNVFSEGLSNIVGRVPLSGFSDTSGDTSVSFVGKNPINAISESFIDGLGELRMKCALSAISESFADSNMQAKGRAVLHAIGESMGESLSLSAFKLPFNAIGNNWSDSNAHTRHVLKLSGISETFSDNISSTSLRALLQVLSDSRTETFSGSMLKLQLSGMTLSNSDAFSNLVKLFDSSLQGISESWADSYAVFIFKTSISGISESRIDSIAGLANVAIVYAGELRKCVGGVLVLADLPSIYNNKYIAGKKLYIYRDGQMQEIKTLSS